MTHKNHSGSSSGRTVKARELQYISRPADAELLDHCQNGRPAYILHSPQMGKSSLIAHTAEQLNTSSHHAVLIDLSQFPLPPREQEWFYNIVRILDNNLDLDTDILNWWEKPSLFALPPHTRLTQLITEVVLPELNGPLILFIDEIERTISLSFREHFFEWLVSLYESRGTNSLLYRFSFVICGVATPTELIPEGGPLIFQWSHRVKLSDFSLPEALPLAEGLSLPTDAAQEAVEWIYRWTNGHPYLTQLLCRLLEEQHRKVWHEAEVDECVRHFIVSPQGLREPNFQFIRTSLTEPDTQGVSLLKPYLNLLEGKIDDLKDNPVALEQLRLVGVLREDDEEIAIRNPLYLEAFPATWVQRHLRSPVPPPPSTSSPLVPSQFSTHKPAYIMAASLFVVVGILAWQFSRPALIPSPLTSPKVTSTKIDTPPASSQNSREPEATQQSEALTLAQEKIHALETTIAEYQHLADEELQNVQDQRSGLETQLHAQATTLSELQTEVTNLKEDLLNQEQAAQQALLTFETDREKLETALTATTNERNAAQLEAKSLQTALLKKSSLAPSEIKKLIADRDQLDTELTTVKQDLKKVQEDARKLTAALAQEELSAQSKEKRFERDQAQLQTQLNTVQVEFQQTQASLKQAEQHSQKQQSLAQQELTRLQKARATLQQQLTEKQRVLTEQESHLSALETTSSKYHKDLQEALEAKATLTAQFEDSQQAEAQFQKRLAQLEADITLNQETADAKQAELQQERDQLAQELSTAQATIESTNNRMTTLSAQLASTKQELANRQGALRDIHASSTEKNRVSDNQLASLGKIRTNLESQLHQKEEELSEARQRISQLEKNAEQSLHLSEALEASNTKNLTLSAKLSSSQQQLDTLQQSLKRAPGVGSQSVPTEQNSSIPDEGYIERVLPLITNAITDSPKNSLPETTRLLWARQAFLFSHRSQGQEWDIIDQALRKGLRTAPVQLKKVSGRVHSLSFDPSGDHVIAGTSEGKVFIWSMNHPNNSPRMLTGHTAGIVTVSVSPDGQHIASGSLDSTIRLWSLSQSNTPSRILQAHTKGVTSLAFRSDGKQLASGSQDNTIRLWNLANDQPRSSVLGKHKGRVNALAYTPNGKRLLSGGDDLTLRLWDLQRVDSPPKILRGHQQRISSVAIHPSGWLVATGSRDRQIGIWNLRQSLISPTFLTGSNGRISQVQFNLDGTSVASVGSDKSLRIWNWNNPSQPPIQFPRHKGTLEALAISPDGGTIAVGGNAKNVTLWAGTEQLAHAVCDTAKENLPFGEWEKIVGEDIPYERTCPNLPIHPSFLEEGKRLATKGSRDQAQSIFERAKQLDPFLKLDPKKEIERLSVQSS